MFEVYCPGHGSPVLLDFSRIEAIHNTAEGPVLDWRCWCGTCGSLIGGTQSVPWRPGARRPTTDAA
jgi:hypothetical protein